jgi:hypothetical protein
MNAPCVARPMRRKGEQGWGVGICEALTLREEHCIGPQGEPRRTQAWPIPSAWMRLARLCALRERPVASFLLRRKCQRQTVEHRRLPVLPLVLHALTGEATSTGMGRAMRALRVPPERLGARLVR